MAVTGFLVFRISSVKISGVMTTSFGKLSGVTMYFVASALITFRNTIPGWEKEIRFYGAQKHVKGAQPEPDDFSTEGPQQCSWPLLIHATGCLQDLCNELQACGLWKFNWIIAMYMPHSQAQWPWWCGQWKCQRRWDCLQRSSHMMPPRRPSLVFPWNVGPNGELEQTRRCRIESCKDRGLKVLNEDLDWSVCLVQSRLKDRNH